MTTRYFVHYLQACAPDDLPTVAGITLDWHEGYDSMGMPRVDVIGPSREAVVEYVRLNWGDDDTDWFTEYVAGRVEALQEDQPCRACGTVFPYDPDADYCPSCAAVNVGEDNAPWAYGRVGHGESL